MREFLLLLFQTSLRLRNPKGAFSFIPRPPFCVNVAPPKKEEGPVSKSISQSSPFFFPYFFSNLQKFKEALPTSLQRNQDNRRLFFPLFF